MSNLNSDELVLVSSIYGRLRAENPHLSSLPYNPLWIRWQLLPADRWRCDGEAQDSERGIQISINPYAFEPRWRLVLEGIINHELVHCLMPHEGHNETFHLAEAGWQGLRDFRIMLTEFREYVKESISGKNRFDYICPHCTIEISVDKLLPKGTACRVCCSTKNRGRHSHEYELKYLGQGTRSIA